MTATEIVGKRCHLRKYSYHFRTESKRCLVLHLSPEHFLFCHWHYYWVFHRNLFHEFFYTPFIKRGVDGIFVESLGVDRWRWPFGGNGVGGDRWGVTGGHLSSSWRITCACYGIGVFDTQTNLYKWIINLVERWLVNHYQCVIYLPVYLSTAPLTKMWSFEHNWEWLFEQEKKKSCSCVSS